jgi:hypothetical protein
MEMREEWASAPASGADVQPQKAAACSVGLRTATTISGKHLA